ncbi:Gfo/Idh/MocA family protein [Halomarina oriensis]|uniref:Uncharacterized protein n=1 Tax=Halomarina oriensis TaxID=671145 RepID=A0A6B0GEC8_9EURY|nr:Gfo/Idh/MocA family oxidoreductase [Halomarina oriensis]MWG33296.1 hypothetical protein [Halomarina oriensis]
MSRVARSEQYRVGVVGAGEMAELAHIPAVSTLDELTLAYVADVDGDRARTVGRAHGVDAVTVTDAASLPQCDVAVLATPVGVRGEYVEVFGTRETPLLAEKPFAPSLDTHRRFLDRGPSMCCNYTRLFFSSTRQASALVAGDAFGELQRASFAESFVGAQGVSPGSYRLDADLSGGGVLAESGCHLLSQVTRLLAGYDLSITEADVRTHEGLDVEVEASLTATAGDRSVPVDLLVTMVTPTDDRVRLEFEHATVTFDPAAPDATLRVTPEEPTPAGVGPLELAPADEWATAFRQGVYLRWEAFLESLRSSDTDWERESGLAVSRLLTALYGFNGADGTDGADGGDEP